jgi:lipopolysaccharide export system permease protein
MRQLERYVMMELLRVFGALITVFTLLLVFVGVFDEARKFELGIWQALQIMPFVIPSLMPYTIPATLLLTVCVVYGRMSADNEIIASRAAGIHIMHLIWPSFFLAALLSVVSLVLTDQIIPWSFGKIERIAALAMEDIFLDKLRAENYINGKEFGITINVTGVRGRTLIHPTIRYAPRGSNPLTMQANEAHIEFDQKRQIVWLTIQGMQGKFAEKNQSFYLDYDRIPYPLPNRGGSAGNRVKRTQDLLVALAIQKERQKMAHQRQAIEAAFSLARGDFDSLNATKFKAHRLYEEQAIDQVRGIRTDYYTRFAMSVSCLFFVLLGSPFAILMAQKQFLTSFLYCFMPILVVYYPIAMMTQNLSKAGQIDPSWSAWMANAALLIAAGYFNRRVMRN